MLMKYAAPTFCVLSFPFSKRSIIYDNLTVSATSIACSDSIIQAVKRFVTILIEYYGPYLMPRLS
jgi:hypothetical protein